MTPNSAINAICPYYTMFPLSFPLRVLAGRRVPRGYVADPFCGRGTTNLAARLCGLPTFGIDSSPIAVAIAQAKLCNTTAQRVVRAARRILSDKEVDFDIPTGDFWKGMYHPRTLQEICKIRRALLEDCRSDTRKVLRAIVLGALHGPLTKTIPSHLSNQSPRTYAPKPAYALRFWKERNLEPPDVDTLAVIDVRSKRYLTDDTVYTSGFVKLGDSRSSDHYPPIGIGLIVTSPPYYGMRTYIPDQWIRAWFLGGPPRVDYEQPKREIQHASRKTFAADLRSVWKSLALRATKSARLVVRFGSINDRDVDDVGLMRDSLRESGWKLTTVVRAGDANVGKRQARQFRLSNSNPRPEHDFYAVLA